MAVEGGREGDASGGQPLGKRRQTLSRRSCEAADALRILHGHRPSHSPVAPLFLSLDTVLDALTLARFVRRTTPVELPA